MRLHFDYGDPVDIYIHYVVHLLSWSTIGIILDGLTKYIRRWKRHRIINKNSD